MTRNDYQEDKNLALQMKNGDDVALQVFFERYANALFAFILIHLDFERRDVYRNDAEDIWQETLFAATQSIASYRGRSRLFTWLCAIARRKIADHFRQQKMIENSLSEGMLGEIRKHITKEQLPEEKEVSELLKQISELGLRSGLEILLWKPEARKTQPEGLYVEIPVRVEVLAEYHRLGDFFSHISRLPRLVNISDIHLRKDLKNMEGIINAKFTARTFASVETKDAAGN